MRVEGGGSYFNFFDFHDRSQMAIKWSPHWWENDYTPIALVNQILTSKYLLTPLLESILQGVDE